MELQPLRWLTTVGFQRSWDWVCQQALLRRTNRHMRSLVPQIHRKSFQERYPCLMKRVTRSGTPKETLSISTRRPMQFHQSIQVGH